MAITRITPSSPSVDIDRTRPTISLVPTLRGPRGLPGASGDALNMTTRAYAITQTIGGSVQFLRTAGYATVGDGGDALYSRAMAEPSHAAKFQSADGAWWELAERRVRPQMTGAVGDGITNDTAAVQAAIDFAYSQQQVAVESWNSVAGGTSSAIPCVDFGGSRYATGPLTIQPYCHLTGENAALVFIGTSSQDLMTGTGAYQIIIDGINFVGGRHALYLDNGNSDRTRWSIYNCEFRAQAAYAIQTATSGGIYHHLSALLTIKNCLFDRAAQVIDNCCDTCIIEDCWVYVDKGNHVASAPIFNNRGDDGNLAHDYGHPRLILRNMFGVPTMGTYGTDRLPNLRWIDNYTGDVICYGCRFGGEQAGMAILLQLGAPATAYPYLPTIISFAECLLSAGPGADSGSGVIILSEIPNIITIRDCFGPINGPYILNPSAFNIAAYMTTYEGASGQKAYDRFSVDISNLGVATDGLFGYGRIPPAMRRFVKGERQTIVTRSTDQTIANGSVNVAISFTSAEFDNTGGWAVANPTRLLVATGATRARITASARITGMAAADVVAMRIIDASANVLAGSEIAVGGVNAGGNYYTVTADVFNDPTSPTPYYEVVMRTNASGSLTLKWARAAITMRDAIN